MSDDRLESRVTALETKVQELEAMVTLALRLLSVEKPVGVLLSRFGATETEDLAVHGLLDDLVQRLGKGEMFRPSFSGFEEELYARFAAMRGNREFVELLIDTLELDRPAYRTLRAFMLQDHWPPWR